MGRRRMERRGREGIVKRFGNIVGKRGGARVKHLSFPEGEGVPRRGATQSPKIFNNFFCDIR